MHWTWTADPVDRLVGWNREYHVETRPVGDNSRSSLQCYVTVGRRGRKKLQRKVAVNIFGQIGEYSRIFNAYLVNGKLRHYYGPESWLLRILRRPGNLPKATLRVMEEAMRQISEGKVLPGREPITRLPRKSR
jgi:hypothetical protein